MEKRLIELGLQRGRLQERIAAQRQALAGQMQPIATALAATDRAVAAARHGVGYVKGHPLEVGAAVAVVAMFKPKTLWRWGRRAFAAWGLWRKARTRLAAAGLFAPRRPA